MLLLLAAAAVVAAEEAFKGGGAAPLTFALVVAGTADDGRAGGIGVFKGVEWAVLLLPMAAAGGGVGDHTRCRPLSSGAPVSAVGTVRTREEEEALSGRAGAAEEGRERAAGVDMPEWEVGVGGAATDDEPLPFVALPPPAVAFALLALGRPPL